MNPDKTQNSNPVNEQKGVLASPFFTRNQKWICAGIAFLFFLSNFYGFAGAAMRNSQGDLVDSDGTTTTRPGNKGKIDAWIPFFAGVLNGYSTGSSTASGAGGDSEGEEQTTKELIEAAVTDILMSLITTSAGFMMGHFVPQWNEMKLITIGGFDISLSSAINMAISIGTSALGKALKKPNPKDAAQKAKDKLAKLKKEKADLLNGIMPKKPLNMKNLLGRLGDFLTSGKGGSGRSWLGKLVDTICAAWKAAGNYMGGSWLGSVIAAISVAYKAVCAAYNATIGWVANKIGQGWDAAVKYLCFKEDGKKLNWFGRLMEALGFEPGKKKVAGGGGDGEQSIPEMIAERDKQITAYESLIPKLDKLAAEACRSLITNGEKGFFEKLLLDFLGDVVQGCAEKVQELLLQILFYHLVELTGIGGGDDTLARLLSPVLATAAMHALKGLSLSGQKKGAVAEEMSAEEAKKQKVTVMDTGEEGDGTVRTIEVGDIDPHSYDAETHTAKVHGRTVRIGSTVTNEAGQGGFKYFDKAARGGEGGWMIQSTDAEGTSSTVEVKKSGEEGAYFTDSDNNTWTAASLEATPESIGKALSALDGPNGGAKSVTLDIVRRLGKYMTTDGSTVRGDLVDAIEAATGASSLVSFDDVDAKGKPIPGKEHHHVMLARDYFGHKNINARYCPNNPGHKANEKRKISAGDVQDSKLDKETGLTIYTLRDGSTVTIGSASDENMIRGFLSVDGLKKMAAEQIGIARFVHDCHLNTIKDSKGREFGDIGPLQAMWQGLLMMGPAPLIGALATYGVIRVLEKLSGTTLEKLNRRANNQDDPHAMFMRSVWQAVSGFTASIVSESVINIGGWNNPWRSVSNADRKEDDWAYSRNLGKTAAIAGAKALAEVMKGFGDALIDRNVKGSPGAAEFGVIKASAYLALSEGISWTFDFFFRGGINDLWSNMKYVYSGESGAGQDKALIHSRTYANAAGDHQIVYDGDGITADCKGGKCRLSGQSGDDWQPVFISPAAGAEKKSEKPADKPADYAALSRQNPDAPVALPVEGYTPEGWKNFLKSDDPQRSVEKFTKDGAEYVRVSDIDPNDGYLTDTHCYRVAAGADKIVRPQEVREVPEGATIKSDKPAAGSGNAGAGGGASQENIAPISVDAGNAGAIALPVPPSDTFTTAKLADMPFEKKGDFVFFGDPSNGKIYKVEAKKAEKILKDIERGQSYKGILGNKSNNLDDPSRRKAFEAGRETVPAQAAGPEGTVAGEGSSTNLTIAELAHSQITRNADNPTSAQAVYGGKTYDLTLAPEQEKKIADYKAVEQTLKASPAKAPADAQQPRGELKEEKTALTPGDYLWYGGNNGGQAVQAWPEGDNYYSMVDTPEGKIKMQGKINSNGTYTVGGKTSRILTAPEVAERSKGNPNERFIKVKSGVVPAQGISEGLPEVKEFTEGGVTGYQVADLKFNSKKEAEDLAASGALVINGEVVRPTASGEYKTSMGVVFKNRKEVEDAAAANAVVFKGQVVKPTGDAYALPGEQEAGRDVTGAVAVPVTVGIREVRVDRLLRSSVPGTFGAALYNFNSDLRSAIAKQWSGMFVAPLPNGNGPDPFGQIDNFNMQYYNRYQAAQGGATPQQIMSSELAHEITSEAVGRFTHSVGYSLANLFLRPDQESRALMLTPGELEQFRHPEYSPENIAGLEKTRKGVAELNKNNENQEGSDMDDIVKLVDRTRDERQGMQQLAMKALDPRRKPGYKKEAESDFEKYQRQIYDEAVGDGSGDPRKALNNIARGVTERGVVTKDGGMSGDAGLPGAAIMPAELSESQQVLYRQAALELLSQVELSYARPPAFILPQSREELAGLKGAVDRVHYDQCALEFARYLTSQPASGSPSGGNKESAERDTEIQVLQAAIRFHVSEGEAWQIYYGVKGKYENRMNEAEGQMNHVMMMKSKSMGLVPGREAAPDSSTAATTAVGEKDGTATPASGNVSTREEINRGFLKKHAVDAAEAEGGIKKNYNVDFAAAEFIVAQDNQNVVEGIISDRAVKKDYLEPVARAELQVDRDILTHAKVAQQQIKEGEDEGPFAVHRLALEHQGEALANIDAELSRLKAGAADMEEHSGSWLGLVPFAGMVANDRQLIRARDLGFTRNDPGVDWHYQNLQYLKTGTVDYTVTHQVVPGGIDLNAKGNERVKEAVIGYAKSKKDALLSKVLGEDKEGDDKDKKDDKGNRERGDGTLSPFGVSSTYNLSMGGTSLGAYTYSNRLAGDITAKNIRAEVALAKENPDAEKSLKAEPWMQAAVADITDSEKKDAALNLIIDRLGQGARLYTSPVLASRTSVDYLGRKVQTDYFNTEDVYRYNADTRKGGYERVYRQEKKSTTYGYGPFGLVASITDDHEIPVLPLYFPERHVKGSDETVYQGFTIGPGYACSVYQYTPGGEVSPYHGPSMVLEGRKTGTSNFTPRSLFTAKIDKAAQRELSAATAILSPLYAQRDSVSQNQSLSEEERTKKLEDLSKKIKELEGEVVAAGGPDALVRVKKEAPNYQRAVGDVAALYGERRKTLASAIFDDLRPVLKDVRAISQAKAAVSGEHAREDAYRQAVADAVVAIEGARASSIPVREGPILEGLNKELKREYGYSPEDTTKLFAQYTEKYKEAAAAGRNPEEELASQRTGERSGIPEAEKRREVLQYIEKHDGIPASRIGEVEQVLQNVAERNGVPPAEMPALAERVAAYSRPMNEAAYRQAVADAVVAIEGARAGSIPVREGPILEGLNREYGYSKDTTKLFAQYTEKYKEAAAAHKDPEEELAKAVKQEGSPAAAEAMVGHYLENLPNLPTVNNTFTETHIISPELSSPPAAGNIDPDIGERIASRRIATSLALRDREIEEQAYAPTGSQGEVTVSRNTYINGCLTLLPVFGVRYAYEPGDSELRFIRRADYNMYGRDGIDAALAGEMARALANPDPKQRQAQVERLRSYQLVDIGGKTFTNRQGPTGDAGAFGVWRTVTFFGPPGNYDTSGLTSARDIVPQAQVGPADLFKKMTH